MRTWIQKMWMNILTLAMALVVLSACSETEPPATTDTMEHVDLAALVSEFKQEVIKVTDGVHVAVGFGLDDGKCGGGDPDQEGI
jgi:hypothetical protein